MITGYEGHNKAVIDGLLNNLHPTVQEIIRSSLQLTFVEMVKAHRDSTVELEQIEQEAMFDAEFGTW